MLLSSTPDSACNTTLADPHLKTTNSCEQDHVATLRPIHALIIDDNKDLARLFADILEVLGCTTEVAWAGQAGLMMAKKHAPDIIFCDINMPGEKSGLDVAKTIRADSELNQTRLIAITGFNDLDSIEEARAAGFESIFGKPIKFAQLREVVENHPDQAKM